MKGRSGSRLMSRTASSNARLPPSAVAFVDKCATRNTPTGNTPDSEWSRRSQNPRCARAGGGRAGPNLAGFGGTFPNDGLTPLARLYLGLIAVDRGDAAGARQVAQGVAAGQSGTTRDLAELLDGAILLEQHATTQA